MTWQRRFRWRRRWWREERESPHWHAMQRACGRLSVDVESDHRDPTMKKIVLLRHGESTWNQENRFTGWTDVGLTEKGLTEAGAAGALLRDEGYEFDLAFTSVLKRAIKTLWVALE